MKKIIALICSCLLFSTLALADRPAMSERTTEQQEYADDETTKDAASAVELDMQAQQRSVRVLTGDSLEIQPGQTLPVRELDFPRRGMTMDKVQNELGSPVDTSPAVGDPPITSWTYNDRIVYFEYSTVVHVVATR